jgi:hypothetical protein
VTSVTGDRLNCGQKAYAFEWGKAFFENNKSHSPTLSESSWNIDWYAIQSISIQKACW